MKMTRWALSLLSLAALLGSVTDADAFFHCHRGCHRCDMHICCRQYNAFTPVCSGNIYCDGCCPNLCGMASGCAMMPSCGSPMPAPCYSGFMGGCGPDCGAGACAPGFSGPFQGGMPSSLPVSAPPSGAPAPNGMPPVFNHTAQYGNPAMGYGVQRAGYYPGYYYNAPAAYYPNAYAPAAYYPNAYYPNAYQGGYNPYANWGGMNYPYYGYGYGYGQRAY